MERQRRESSLADIAPVRDEAASLGVLAELIGYRMRRASGVIGTDFARALEGTGIRQVLFGILSIVAANPGCTLQIQAHLRELGRDLPVYHPMELLHRALA